MNRNILLATAAAIILPVSAAQAQTSPTTGTTPEQPHGPEVQQASPQPAPPAAAYNIVVTGRRLDVARDNILPSLGASLYTIPHETLERQPGGTNVTLNKVLLQAPGVNQDSYGQLEIRNDHAIQYRLNGVIVPESISGFGTTFDPRIAESIELLTGTLPAQYGYRTSGIVNFKTHNGVLHNEGEAGIYGGSFGRIEPSVMVERSSGNINYFLSGSFLRDDLGIENPLPTRNAIHDRTTQFRPFGYVSDILSDTSRISLFGGSFIAHFQIPNVTGEVDGFRVNGVSSFDAAKLNLNQGEITHYAVSAYQYGGSSFNAQIAPFIRYTQTTFSPDPNQYDIIANGFADRARLSGLAAGVQADASQQIGSHHTLRGGAFFSNEHTTSNIVSNVLCTDPTSSNCPANLASDAPFTITDRGSKTGQIYGLYLQDEWKITPALTLNYGARYDVIHAYTHESQLSPRANLVWTATPLTTFHVGYARNFTPPAQELIAPSDISLYTGTTKEPEVAIADPVRAQREHYFDAGVEQRFAAGAKIGIDAYYKKKRNQLDEGQFGSAVVLSPFNYAKGYAWGVELTGAYARGPVDLYANLARGQEKVERIVSGQYFFAPDELAYIANHYIFADHSEKWNASGGASYTINDGPGRLVPSADILYGSGLRTDDPNGIVPNGGELPGYFVANAGIAQNFTRPGALNGVTIRADVENLFDKKYLIRSGEGVGVGAPTWGARRGFFVGVTKSF